MPQDLTQATGPVPDGEHLVALGRANVVREGADLTVVTSGWFVGRALEAADRLEGEGVGVEVVDLRTLAPVDWDTVAASARKTGRVVVYDQGHYHCGIGPTVAAGIQERAFRSLKAPVVTVASADVPVPYNLTLAQQVVPTVERLVESSRALLSY
jgi:pyruvate dehydrogenase E1 component beta subunit